MDIKACQQCRQAVNNTYNRLICDSCGHYKCRSCLLLEADQCFSCLVEEKCKNDQPASDKNLSVEYPIMALNNINVDLGDKYFEASENAPANLSKKLTSSSEFNSYASEISMKDTRNHIDTDKVNNCTLPDNKKNKFSKICPICNESFDAKKFYIQHIHQHYGKKLYFCNTCGSLFCTKSKLIRHITVHSGIKAFKCSECEANFSNPYSLKKHNLIHSGLKPFKCKTCEKTFRDSSNLKKHELNHYDIKKYVCSDCGKQYKMKCSLLIHIRSHLNEMPWNCSTCQKSFYTKKDKNRHELIHLDEKKFKCHLCETMFRRKDNLDRHIRSSHIHLNFQNAIVTNKNNNNIKNNDSTLDYKKNKSNKCLLHSNENCDINKSEKLYTYHDYSFSPNQNQVKTVGFEQSILNEQDCMDNKSTNSIENATRLKILEANNKRQSVIFKSDTIEKCQFITLNAAHKTKDFVCAEHNNIAKSELENKIVKNISQYITENPDNSINISDQLRITNYNDNSNNINLSEIKEDKTNLNNYSNANTSATSNDRNVDIWKENYDFFNGPYYKHKKVHYNVKNILPVSSNFIDFNEKSKKSINQISGTNVHEDNHYSRESIELYKKILCPSYKSDI